MSNSLLHAPLSVEDFNNTQPGTAMSVVALFKPKSFATSSLPSGTLKTDAVVSCTDGDVKLLSFDTRVAEVMGELAKYDTPTLVTITGIRNEYRGTHSIKVNTFAPYTGSDYSVDAFKPQPRYDFDSLMSTVNGIFDSTLSPAGRKVFDMVFAPLADRYRVEYAARAGGKNHDNVPAGLLWHSFKCLWVLHYTMPVYDKMGLTMSKDLVYIGTFLHDLGKVFEYFDGEMSPVGEILSHRELAIMHLMEFRPQIVELFSEEWFNRLCSIMAYHHGQYEGTPRTVEAMVVHSVDMYESSMTNMIDNALSAGAGGSFTHRDGDKFMFLSVSNQDALAPRQV